MRIIKQYWTNRFISQTFSCIEGRGIHSCLNAVKKALKDKNNTKYCLKLDIKKFYPSIIFLSMHPLDYWDCIEKQYQYPLLSFR